MGPYGDERGEAPDGTRYPQWLAWALLAFFVGCYVYANWRTWRRWWIEPPPFAFFRSSAGRVAWGVAGCLAFWPFVLALYTHRFMPWGLAGIVGWAYLIGASAYGKRLENRPRDVWENMARDGRETRG